MFLSIKTFHLTDLETKNAVKFTEEDEVRSWVKFILFSTERSSRVFKMDSMVNLDRKSSHFNDKNFKLFICRQIPL